MLKLEGIAGIKVVSKLGKKYIKFLEEISRSDLKQLLTFLKEHEIDFEIYDKFYPSPSDPGAYMAYSRKKSIDKDFWSMTLGNHGWTGGIYMINESTILTQLEDLLKNKAINKILINDVAFFSHYEIEDSQKSSQKGQEILNLHKKQN